MHPNPGPICNVSLTRRRQQEMRRELGSLTLRYLIIAATTCDSLGRQPSLFYARRSPGPIGPTYRLPGPSGPGDGMKSGTKPRRGDTLLSECVTPPGNAVKHFDVASVSTKRERVSLREGARIHSLALRACIRGRWPAFTIRWLTPPAGDVSASGLTCAEQRGCKPQAIG